MLFTLDEIMTPREACDRWEITLDNLHMKLNRLKNSDVLNGLIKEGKAKYYKPEGKKRGEWIFTIEEINKVQQVKLLEMEQRLGDRIDQRNKLIENDIKDRKEREERIEKRLELRDDNFMEMVREIQDAKRTIVLAQQEIAAAKKKSW